VRMSVEASVIRCCEIAQPCVSAAAPSLSASFACPLGRNGTVWVANNRPTCARACVCELRVDVMWHADGACVCVL